MRSYPTDSPQAVARLLVMTVIADGESSPLETAAAYRIEVLDHAAIQEDVFDRVLDELRDDLPTTPDGLVTLDKDMVDQMLAEISLPDLRRKVWNAMWQLSYADDRLADGELALLLLATSTWGIKEGCVRVN
jgi:uncharacterized tellurite resistance protein B-like protein